MTSLIGVRTPSGVRTPYYIKRAITIVITIKMNSCEQVLWAKGLNVDEVVPWEIRNLCNLMNVIFSEAVDCEVQKLRKEKCCGCEVNHPSQRRHDCIMTSEEEGWIIHGSEAVEQVIKHQTVSKHFTEAIRVMKLDPHKHVVEHFKKLTKDPETTGEFLKDLKFNSSFPEYQAILGVSQLLERRTLNGS